jgi:DNA-binding NarL/FixJ family response regulator
MVTPTDPVFSIVSCGSDPPLVSESVDRLAPAAVSVQQLALAADGESSAELCVASLWQDLARGRYRVVEGFFSDQRCFLVLSVHPVGAQTPIEGRRREILEAVLGGLRQKNVAMDLALAPSTVALNARLALEGIGVGGKPSRAHPLLMLAARTAAASLELALRCSTVRSSDGELRVVSLPRPDLALDGLLPSAELAVIRSLIEGCSYEEIAEARGTSTRTVANQISAVFRRLRVSGRNELVLRLFVGGHLEQPPDRAGETLTPPEPEPPASTRRSVHDTRRSA